MKNFFNKLYLSLVFMLSVMANAQSVPPPPPQPESGDTGGLATTPIDMYLIWLIFAAFIMIYFVAMKTRKEIFVK